MELYIARNGFFPFECLRLSNAVTLSPDVFLRLLEQSIRRPFHRHGEFRKFRRVMGHQIQVHAGHEGLGHPNSHAQLYFGKSQC